jgi:Ser/Thr protein kinase RdoA (MazF antagonist)
MTHYDGTVAELAEEVGQALALIHKMLSSIKGKTQPDLVSKEWEPDLATVANLAQKLQGDDTR